MTYILSTVIVFIILAAMNVLIKKKYPALNARSSTGKTMKHSTGGGCVITLIILIILVAVLFHSCGNTYGDITKEQAEKYVKNKFGESYTISAAYEDFDSSDTDIMSQYGLEEKDKLYIFSDTDEFQFSIKLRRSQGMFNASYFSSCDYFPQYVYFHPEYYQKLFKSGYEITPDENGTGYCMEISDFDRIETAIAFADGFINSLEPIWCTDYQVEAEDDDTEISLTEANIYICAEGNTLAQLHYMTSENSEPNNLNGLIYNAKERYVQLYRAGSVHGNVSDEEFEKRPASELKLMYHGEPIQDEFSYREGTEDEYTGEYLLYLNYQTTEYGAYLSVNDCDFLEKLAGEKSENGNQTVFVKNGREIIFSIENGVLTITSDGGTFTPETVLYGHDYDKGDYIGTDIGNILLSVKDIQEIFGASVNIDQRTAAAVIKEIQ